MRARAAHIPDIVPRLHETREAMIMSDISISHTVVDPHLFERTIPSMQRSHDVWNAARN